MAVRGRRPPDAAEVSRVVCKKSTENLVLVKKSFFVLFAIFKAFLKFNEIFRENLKTLEIASVDGAEHQEASEFIQTVVKIQ